jgi:hypothetical protein
MVRSDSKFMAKNAITKAKDFSTLSCVQKKKWDLIKFSFAIGFVAIAFVPIARADEAPKLVPLQTALSSTVISGYVRSGSFELLPNTLITSQGLPSRMENRNSERDLLPIEFYRPQRTEGASLTPFLPPSLGIDNTAVFESSLTLTPANSPMVSLTINPTVSSSGTVMTETILADLATDEMPAPAMQQFPVGQVTLGFQAGIEPVPEPSTFALGGLAVGLIVLTRLNSRPFLRKQS